MLINIFSQWYLAIVVEYFPYRLSYLESFNLFFTWQCPDAVIRLLRNLKKDLAATGLKVQREWLVENSETAGLGLLSDSD